MWFKNRRAQFLRNPNEPPKPAEKQLKFDPTSLSWNKNPSQPLKETYGPVRTVTVKKPSTTPVKPVIDMDPIWKASDTSSLKDRIEGVSTIKQELEPNPTLGAPDIKSI